MQVETFGHMINFKCQMLPRHKKRGKDFVVKYSNIKLSSLILAEEGSSECAAFPFLMCCL